MKSKRVLMLVAAMGSAALVASAQTPSPSVDALRTDRIEAVTITPDGGGGTSVGITAAATAATAATAPGAKTGVGSTQAGAPSVGGSQDIISAPVPGYPNESRIETRTYYGPRSITAKFVVEPGTDHLLSELAEAKTDLARDAIKAKLSEVLAKQFEQRQKQHESEIAELEAKVKKLKDMVARRQENRREIVARRLEQVLRESQGLGW